MGPVGGSYRVTPNSSAARISVLTAGAPGVTAGLQVGDYIYGAFDRVFTPTGNYHYGVSQELGFAVDRAEAGDGNLPLMILRPGTGGVIINVSLPAAGGFGPAYPRNSAKFAAVYETAVADLHSRAMSSNGSMGYFTGWTGLALLGHPNWNDSTGAKPYRLSVNKVRDFVIGQINGANYAPTEDLLLAYQAGQANGGANPNSRGGLSNWQLGQMVMFLAEFYTKTKDFNEPDKATVAAALQRGAEMCGNSIQWWKQPSQTGVGGFSPEYAQVAGMCSHGGVTGDYMHQGWYCGINICGVYSFNGMAFSRRAGMDMNVRPKDGHYWGYTLNQGDTIPPGVAGCLPASITLPQYGADPVLGSTINDPFWYDPSVHQKFTMQLNFLARRSTYYNATSTDDGAVGYAPEAITSYDAGGRTPGTLLGMAMFNQDAGGLDSADLARMESLKGYITRNYMRHQEAHAYCVGAQAYQALCTPYLSDRQQRFFMDNWRFFFALMRTSTNGIQYFPSRSVADNYLDTNHCASLNIALPYAIANGSYSLVPAYNTVRSLADFKAPALMWPQLAARAATIYAQDQAFQIDICDGDGNVLAPAAYTATWSHVSGPATATFAPDNTANTTVSFPTVSATPYRIRLTVARAGVPDLVEDIDITRANAPAQVANAITAQPVTQAVVPGGNASFSVTVSGTAPIIYQWRLNGVPYWGTSSSPTLSLTNVGTGAAGNYDCLISSPAGTLVSNSAALTITGTLARTPGGLRREVWTGIGGSSISNLTAILEYPLFPTTTGVLTSAESPSGYGDNYGQKLSGWIKPPVSGAYKFHVSSDDASQVWLSTDDTVANKVMIAGIAGATGYRAYSSGAQSALITLVAGQKYYIEILHKEGGGGDHVSVAWQMPGEAVPANGSAPIDGVYLEYEQYLPLLVDHWKLDESSGTTAVNSVRALDGTHTNGPLVNQSGATTTGKSVYYDGSNDYTFTAAPNYNTNTLTMLAWVKRNGVQPAWAPIYFCRAGNTCAGFGSGDVSGNLRYHWNGSQYTWDSGLTLPDNQWALVAMVVTPSGTTMHMRTTTGLQSATHSVNLATEEFDGTMAIGADISISTRRFKGWIDDARIYKAALAASDIETLYNAGINSAPQLSATAFAVAENSAIGTTVGTVTATDADAGQALSYGIVGGNVGNRFAMDPGTGTITVAAPIDHETFGTCVLTVTATDNGSPVQTATNAATITISDINEAPVFASNPLTGQQGAVGMAYSGNVTAIDPDAGSSISFAKTSGPAWMVVASTGELTGTPAAGNTGTNAFTIRATDNTGLTTDVTLNIPVINPADAPVWINPSGGSWLTASNWYGNAVATGSGITADFSTLNLTADTTVSLDGARTIGGLKFGDTTPSHNWTLSTGSGGPLTLQASSGSPIVNVVNQTATIGSALDGTMGLTKSGTGTLVLTGTNIYTGDTVLTTGTLRVGNGGTSGNLGGMAVTDNGILEISRSDSITLPQAIAGTGKIYAKPGGSYIFSGPLNIGTFRFDVGGSRTVTFSGSEANAINVIEDSQDGHGNLYFAKTSGVNAFSGPVLDVGAGYASQFQVRLDNHNQIADTTRVAMYGWDGGYGGRSWFRLNGFNETIAGLTGGTSQSYVQNNAATPSVLTLAGSGTYTLGGYLNNGSTGTLSLVMNGSGSQTLSGGGIGYTGATSVNNGTLRLSQTTAFASASTTVTSPGILELTSTNTAVDNWRLNTVLAGTGVINKTGAGWVQTNTNASTFSGTVNIQAGAFGASYLTSNWTGVTANFNVSTGALLDARGQAITLGGLNGDGLVGTTWTSAATVTLGAGNKSGGFSGVISGNASSATNLTANPNAGILSLVKIGTGTQTLSGANTYTGSTTVNGGTLIINGSLGTTTTSVAAAGTLGGTGSLGGPVNCIGTLAPGGTGIGNLTINNALTLVPDSSVIWQISDWTGVAGTGYDKLTVGSLAITATTVDPVVIRLGAVSLVNFTESSATFTLLQCAGSITGFDPAKFVVDASGLATPQGNWAVHQSGGNLVLVYTRYNTAPVFFSNPITANATEDSVFSGQLAATDPDIGETLVFSKVSGPAWLDVTSTGALAGTPVNTDAGLNVFTVRVTDSDNATVTATLNVTVANVNDAPVFTANPITGTSATEDAAYTGSLAGTASDVDAGDTLSYSKSSGPAWLVVAADGTLSGTPANDDVGTNDFVVRATDVSGLFAESTLNISVTNSNDAPVFVADPFTATVTENSAITGSIAATDIDADDTLTFSKLSGPAWLVVAADGSLSGTPDINDVGVNNFVVRVTDAGGLTDDAAMTVTVNPLNNTPVFATNPISTTAVLGYAFTGQLAASDPDAGDTISFAKVSGPAWLDVAADGSMTGTPGAGSGGLNSFTVRATDNHGASVDASLDITVVDYSSSTLWTNSAGGSWPTGTNWQGGAAADGNAQVANFSTLNLTADAVVTLDGARTIGGLKFGDTTPSHNWTLNSGSGGSLTLQVLAGTPALTVNNQTATINTPIAGTMGLVKLGTGTLALGAANPLTGTFSIEGGLVRQNVNSTFATATVLNITNAALEVRYGSYNVNWVDVSTVTLGGGATLRAAPQYQADNGDIGFKDNITVIGTNTVYATGGSYGKHNWLSGGMTGDSAAYVNLSNGAGYGAYADRRAIILESAYGNWTGYHGTIQAVNDVTIKGTVDLRNAKVIVNGTIGLYANGAIGEFGELTGAGTLEANAKTGGEWKIGNLGTSATYAGIINGASKLTKVGAGTLTLTNASTYSGATTINAGTLMVANASGSATGTGTVSIATGAALGGTGSLAGAVINNGSLVPGNNAVGNLTVNNTLTLAGGSDIIWQVSDWTGAAGTGSDKLTVGTLDITATAGNPVTIRLSESALANFTETNANFTLVQTSGGITGFDPSKFAIDTTALPTAQGTWTVQQSGNNLVLVYSRINTAPVFTANPILVGGTEDTAVTGSITAVDPDLGETLTYAKLSGPAWLAIDASGVLTGTPLNADVGLNAFTVQVTDSFNVSATTTLEITVANVNDAPVFTADPFTASATEDSAFSGTLTATDDDAGDTRTYSKVSGPAWLTVAADGTLAGTPLNADVGANGFVVRVTDAGGLTDDAALVITVANVNDSPVFTADPITASATEDSAFTGALTATDIDDGDTRTYSKVSGPAWLTVAADGTLGGTPLNANVGANGFVVRVTDAGGLSDDAALTITVANTNDAPAFTVSPISKADATQGTAYTGQSLAGSATDPDAGDTQTYSKVSGPTWLTVAANGALGGTPGAGTAGVNAFTVRVTDGSGASADATLNITVLGLPAPWVNADIGTTGLAGSSTHVSGAFTVTGGGVIGGTVDGEQFAYQTLSGDGSIVARVSTLGSTGGSSARVGIQIRDTLAANSKATTLAVTGSGSYKWMRRTTAGGSTSSTNSSSGTAPNIWIKMVRAGNVITASKSTNGTSWTTIGSVTVTMASNCYVGLAVGSGSTTATNTSVFNNVTVVP